MVSSPDASTPRFNGSNWVDLNRVVALARFQFLQDSDYDDEHDRRCAYLMSSFEGPALDWAASEYARNPAIINNFDNFVNSVRMAFGIADNNITALLRRELDNLSWHVDVPVFFAEFDRLTTALNITGHDTRVAMVEAKLPLHMKVKLAEQALAFQNYETMRERLNCMWAMDPTRGKTVTHSKPKRLKCTNCGKRGHSTADCRRDK